MNDWSVITRFIEQARVDPRIGPLHVSLYLAVFYLWMEQGGVDPVPVSAKELMPVAKIGGTTPFYRCIKELHRYGYIVYEPSFNAARKSRVRPVVSG